ncbi:MAG TPA: outer membrane beta-barrel protein [Terracidiphilus sp.]|nr:outer membrane beta-barrel protein [Terracidiphilus sp.]
MKKIVFLLFLMAVAVAAGRAQESRQDISISGTAIVEPFMASSTDVQVHSNTGFGALLSYRFMMTPTSALEVNYGIDYQNTMRYIVSNTNVVKVTARDQEISAGYVRSFVFRKWNPFVEAGPAALIFLPIRNSGTTSIDVKQQTVIAGMFGAGVAYEISPSFDIRAEYRGLIAKIPNFGQSAGATNMNLSTNRWYTPWISEPVVGVAYHF